MNDTTSQDTAPEKKAPETTAPETTGTQPALPDRLSINPRSPHHIKEVFEHNIGIKVNGKERNDVEEYCISEGWVKVASAKALDRRGQPLLVSIKGTVEAFYN